MCELTIPQEQAWLRVLARPGRFVPSTIPREQGRIVTMLKFVCLGTFRRTLTGRRSTPSFALQFSQFPRLDGDGNMSSKVATPLSVPLPVKIFACATSTAHYHRTCRPLYPRHGGRDYPKSFFNSILMTFYDPVQEYQTGWSQKTTLHHVFMMGETFSRHIYASQYSSRAVVKNCLATGTTLNVKALHFESLRTKFRIQIPH